MNKSLFRQEETFGIIYVALGWKHLVMACNSAHSLNQLSEAPATLVTNLDIRATKLSSLFQNIVLVSLEDHENRIAKISMHRYSPYSRTLFVDADTEFVRDPVRAGASEILADYDLALRLHHEPYGSVKDDRPQSPFRPEFFASWNSGVVLFRRTDATKEFFDEWLSTFQAGSTEFDQPSLIDCLHRYRAQLRFLSLHLGWNVDRLTARKQFKKAFAWQVIDHRRDTLLYRLKIRSFLRSGYLEEIATRYGPEVKAKLLQDFKLHSVSAIRRWLS